MNITTQRIVVFTIRRFVDILKQNSFLKHNLIVYIHKRTVLTPSKECAKCLCVMIIDRRSHFNIDRH